MALFGNRYFLVFAGLYLLSVFTLVFSGVYSIAEPLFILVIFGLFFPGLAFFLCRKASPLPQTIKVTGVEMLALLGCVFLVVIYLIWGGGFLTRALGGILGDFPGQEAVLRIAEKLLVFVAVPLVVFSKGFGYALKDLGFSKNLKAAFSRRNLLIFAIFALLFQLLQFLIGQAAQSLFKGVYSLEAILLGGLVLFPFLVIQVGLVEEFFFRVLVQSRMAAWFQSEIAGLVIMALLFGLAHAPGLYLRGTEGVTVLGANPSIFDAIAYTIVVLSLSALVFGVIWAKTRNLYILVLIHASVDLLPALPRFLDGLGMK